MDYSHRNPDGSVGKVPDSLISEFKTQSGRKVYDGGGISPDIKITPEDYARITQELVLQDLTFDFINSYALRHPNIAPINEFKITDEIYNEFKTYLKEKKFSYETESQQILNEAAKAEKYYDTAKEQIAALENDFTHSIDRDMDLFKDEITSFLTEQFIQRYYYLQGVIEYKVQHDQEVAKAVEVLNDKEVYRNTLKPVK